MRARPLPIAIASCVVLGCFLKGQAMSKITGQSAFFVSEGVPRSTEEAKAEFEAENERVMGPYFRGAIRDNLRNVLKSFYLVTKQNRVTGKP